MAFIDVIMLEEKGACSEQCRVFEDAFPNGVEVTPELCVKYARMFDWEWANVHLLSHEGTLEYDTRIRAAAKEMQNEFEAAHAEKNGCGERCMNAEREFEEAKARVFGELYSGCLAKTEG